VASVIARLEAQRDCDYAAQLAQDAFEAIIAREPDAKLLAAAAAEAFNALAAQNFSSSVPAIARSLSPDQRTKATAAA
jgi:hypothetical protein